MTLYTIAVSWRSTNASGAWVGNVDAETKDAAIARAHQIVRAQHGCRLFRIVNTECAVSAWNRKRKPRA
jgi:hypothetical protein